MLVESVDLCADFVVPKLNDAAVQRREDPWASGVEADALHPHGLGLELHQHFRSSFFLLLSLSLSSFPFSLFFLLFPLLTSATYTSFLPVLKRVYLYRNWGYYVPIEIFLMSNDIFIVYLIPYFI